MSLERLSYLKEQQLKIDKEVSLYINDETMAETTENSPKNISEHDLSDNIEKLELNFEHIRLFYDGLELKNARSI